MQVLNVTAVIDAKGQRVLMCLRRKPPFQGLLNFVGGKVKPGEGRLQAAYRELSEETGITPAQIELFHLMDLIYYYNDWHLEVYFGRLREEVAVVGEENPLQWVSLTENFFDTSRFAGEGNLGHIIRQIQLNWQLLEEKPQPVLSSI